MDEGALFPADDVAFCDAAGAAEDGVEPEVEAGDAGVTSAAPEGEGAGDDEADCCAKRLAQ